MTDKELLKKAYEIIAVLRGNQIEKKSEAGNIIKDIWVEYQNNTTRIIQIQKLLDKCLEFEIK